MSDDGADDPSPDHGKENGTDGTVPRVDLSLHELTVSVTGQSDDDLGDVEETAQHLMDYLVDRAEDIENEPDQYGLS